jgi:hypothetical protein
MNGAVAFLAQSNAFGFTFMYFFIVCNGETKCQFSQARWKSMDYVGPQDILGKIKPNALRLLQRGCHLSIIQLIWKNEKRKFLPSNYVSKNGKVAKSQTYSQ